MKRRIVIAIAPLPLLAAALLLAPRPAGAAYNLPWCGQYFDMSLARTCSFPSYQACRETMTGVGGYCFSNPAAPLLPPPAVPYRREKPHRRASPH